MGGSASVTDELRESGNTAFQTQQYETAVELYTKAIQQNAGDYRLYSNRAAALIAQRKYSLAIPDAYIAITLKPDWPKGYYRAGVALHGVGSHFQAAEMFLKALALEPTNTDIQQARQAVLDELRANYPTTSPTSSPKLRTIAAGEETAIGRGNGWIYSWGGGGGTDASFGGSRHSVHPKIVDGLRGKEIADVACGMAFTVVVTAAKEAFVWGDNTQAQCGLGHKRAVTTPTLVPQLLGVEIVGISCGAGHTVAVSSQHIAYSWGMGSQGQLGHGDTKPELSPKPISALTGTVVGSVSCGIGHSVVCESDGTSLWSFGWNNCGQLGLGNTNNVSIPTKVKLPPNVKVQHISCGGAHTALVSRDGALYTTGSASCGQLGLQDFVDRTEFTHVSTLQHEEIAFVRCGEEFTIVITSSHSVYSFGLGNVGQLGLGKIGENSNVPRKIEELEGHGVEMLACTQSQVLAVTNNGHIFTWGLPGADPNLISLNTSSLESKPTRLRVLQKKQVVRLEAGRKHYCSVVVGTCAKLCRVLGIPTEPLTAGDMLRFRIIGVDTLGNDRESGGDVFQIMLVHGSTGDTVITDIDISDNFDGSYEVSYRVKVNGDYSLHIDLAGMNVGSSAYQVVVQSGPPYPPNCQVEWWSEFLEELDGSACGIPVGTSLLFTIQMRDKYNNTIDPDDVQLIDVALLTWKCQQQNPEATSAIRQDDGNLFTSCQFHKTGEAELSIFYNQPNCNDANCGGCPITVNILPGPAEPSQCNIVPEDVKTLQNFETGQTVNFHMEFRDKYGNIANMQDAECKAVLKPQQDPTTAQQKDVPCWGVTNTNPKQTKNLPWDKGTWAVQVATSGSYTLHFTINGDPIKDTPLPIMVVGMQKDCPLDEDGLELITVASDVVAQRKERRRLKKQQRKEFLEEQKKQQELRKLHNMEMTRRRAEEALLRTQRDTREQEERKRRDPMCSSKRTGGGFVVYYNNWVGDSLASTPEPASYTPARKLP